MLARSARLHDRLHARRSGLQRFFAYISAVHVRDADARDVEQLPAALLRLGGGGTRLVPADRLLVQAPDRDLREPTRPSSSTAIGDFALHRRRSRSSSPYMGSLDYAEVFAARSARAIGHDLFPTPGEAVEGHHGDLRRRCSSARWASPRRCRCTWLAARLDGRPDADLGADPRRDDGDRRHLHGGAACRRCSRCRRTRCISSS